MGAIRRHGIRFCLVYLALSSLFGCATQPGALIERPVMQIPPMPGPALRQETILGATVSGAPIVMKTFGQSGPWMLILGGIHGDERASVDVARELSIELEKSPELCGNRRVAIIEIANPDGYARNTRTNTREIDVNRNFPARNFKPGGPRGYRGGSSPASEPETQAILSAIAQLRPNRLISIHCIRGGKQCNNYDGPGEKMALVMAAQNGYPVTPTIGYPTPGSLGSYAGIDLGIAMVTLELPRGQPGPDAWARNRQALLDAIASND